MQMVKYLPHCSYLEDWGILEKSEGKAKNVPGGDVCIGRLGNNSVPATGRCERTAYVTDDVARLQKHIDWKR